MFSGPWCPYYHAKVSHDNPLHWDLSVLILHHQLHYPHILPCFVPCSVPCSVRQPVLGYFLRLPPWLPGS
eukprot:Gb_11399 [translate_table: standard]